MTLTARSGAVAFALWGLLHIGGGASILAAALGDPAQGYAFYRDAAGPFPPVAGAILTYFAFLLIVAGAAVLAVAIGLNWRNSRVGLAANTAFIGAVELGLILFLLLPGYLGLGDAAPGFVLYALGVVLGGYACRGEHDARAVV